MAKKHRGESVRIYKMAEVSEYLMALDVFAEAEKQFPEHSEMSNVELIENNSEIVCYWLSRASFRAKALAQELRSGRVKVCS